MREFIEIPSYMKPNKDDNFNLVEIKDGIPHCKKHGAMNKFPNGIWRCLSEYGYEYKEGNSMPTFRDRTCCACCFELTMEHLHQKIMEISSDNSKTLANANPTLRSVHIFANAKTSHNSNITIRERHF